MSLRGLREAVGLTQERLAFLVGVSRYTIIRWEQGLAQPSPSTCRKLAWTFRVSESDVMEAVIRGSKQPA